MQNSIASFDPASLTTAKFEAARLASDGARTITGRRDLDQAAQKFEAMFVQQMLQPMFDTVAVDETFGGGSAETMWRSMMVEQMSSTLVKKSHFGIADMVRNQFIKMQEQSHEPVVQPDSSGNL